MDRGNNWWTRPCGGWDVLRQAVPLIISGGCLSLINFTDRVFLMWYSPDAMTASMLGGMLFWAVVALPWAVAAFVTTFVAQYNGSGQYHRVGRIVWQGIWFGLFMMPILLLLYRPFTEIFVWFGHEEHMVELQRTYYFYTLLGCGGAIAAEAAASYFRGQGKMKIEMMNNIFCLFLNVFLNFCLIFGYFGFPAWGLAGAAIGTAIVLWVRFFVYVILMFMHDWNINKFHVLGGLCLDLRLMGRLCFYGIPAGLFTFIDNVAFTVFLLMLGGLGEVYRNATTIAFTLNSFTYIPLMGIGIAVTAMVGNQLGKNRPDLARRVAMTAQVIGCTYTGFFGLSFLLFPGVFLSVFAAYTSPEEFAAAYDMTVILLRFVALYLFFDCIAVIFFATLRGAGDTIFIAWLTALLAPLLPIFCFLGIKFFGLGILWCWTVLTVYIIVYCFCLILRYRSKIWESMRVIEKEII